MELPKTSDTKAVAPQESVQPSTEASTPPVEKTETAPATPVVTPAPPKEGAVVPTDVVPVSTNKKSILPGTILTKEDKKKISLKKKGAQQQIQFLKHITFLFILLSAGWFSWLQINISQSNSVLSIIGINENVGQKIKRLKKDKTKINLENKTLTRSITKIEDQLEKGVYTRFSTEIQNIRDKQIQWFDKVNEKGEITFGLIDAVPHIQEYFNSRSYHDPNSILSGKHSDIQIENLQVSREGVNFSVLGSQLLGKVFFLNIEFVEMVNSFSFLKNGEITQFARQKNADDDDMMRFSVRLERQLPGEKDIADERFSEYTTWLNTVNTK